MTTNEKLNGTQAKALNIEKFKTWIASMKPEDYVPLVSGSKLKRVMLEELTGILRKNFTVKYKDTTNILKEMLSDLESKLREDGILPPLTSLGEAEVKKPTIDKESIKAAREQSRVPKLEQDILHLKAEIKALKGELGRYSELSEVYQALSEQYDD